jgi:hypothetical protein
MVSRARKFGTGSNVVRAERRIVVADQHVKGDALPNQLQDFLDRDSTPRHAGLAEPNSRINLDSG